MDANGWPTEASRLCRSSIGTDVDAKNEVQANFVYTIHAAMATEISWSERLMLGERSKKSLSLRLHQTTTLVAQNSLLLLAWYLDF